MSDEQKRATLGRLAGEIAQELRNLGVASTKAVSVPARGAFGAGSMPFQNWLQDVMLPNLEAAAVGGTMPKQSNLAIAAIRNLDGVVGTDRLIDLLSEVDRTIDQV